ncbi:MAG TPA: prepilin-type N-terminal cleavage/methylation domain-containing protein [Verrucomicrobiae bacterium]|nr:prepilin-type N-terminal cleavage/methylation domain-containing protein [Verrucomicrobiae bacterium]
MRKPAFTLVELMITVAIIGILAAIASVSYSGVRTRARDAQRINDLNQIKVVLSTYYAAQTPQVYVSAPSAVTVDGSTDALSLALEPNYIREMPVDPLNTGSNIYKYQSANSAKAFTLFGTFENKENKKGWNGGSVWVVDGYRVQND